MQKDKNIHGYWRSRWLFILAATGSAVGLGNIWKFPYITGENGGGAFVVVYLLCISLVGIPVMIAEVTLGRLGRQSPINTMKELTRTQGANHLWSGVGWMGAVAGFLILSFYSVVAGWALAYIARMVSGSYSDTDAEAVGAIFGELLGNPLELTLWHSIFLLITIFIVARGVNKGLERSISILMPLLFVLLLVLLGYAMNTEGFGAGFDFLFNFDFSRISATSIIVAMGHAFFTLSLGMGAIMAYGAYMPHRTSLGTTVVTIAILDTVVALVAGLIIFPVVFTNGLEAAAGPGLLFQTLPLAFSQMPAGMFFGSLFFILVTFAALSSAISLAEPVVAWAVEKKGWSRALTAGYIGAAIWLLGIGSVLSFNLWSEHKVFGKTFFDLLDFLTANIMLPLGGLLIAVFVGWIMRQADVKHEVNMKSNSLYNLWSFVLRFVAPLAVAFVLINGLV